MKNLDKLTNRIDKLFCDNIAVIEEDWFSETNLTDGANFTLTVMKCENRD